MLRSFPPVQQGDELSHDSRWIDLVDPTDREIAAIRDRFDLEVPTLDDLTKIAQSRRLQACGDTLLMSAPLISGTNTERWTVAPVGFILTPTVCITVRFATLDAFDSVAKSVANSADIAPIEIFARLLEEIVDRAADHLEQGAGVVNDTSQSIFFDEPKRRQLSKNTVRFREAMRTIGQVSDHVSRVRYAFLSIGRMAAFVMDRCTPKIEGDLRERLCSICDDIESLDDYEVSLSERIELIQDAAAGFISIAQNDVVKVLTVVSVAGVPPVLVVGIYGMNFRYMPELTWRFGYPFALALCVASVIIPLLWFKWRDWI